MVSGFSADSGKGGGQPIPTVHCRNMYKWYEPTPLYEEVQRSNRGKQLNPFLDMKMSWSPEGDP